MPAANSKRQPPAGQPSKGENTADHSIILQFPIYKSPIPYSAGIKLYRNRDHFLEEHPILFPDDKKPEDQKPKGEHDKKKEEISTSYAVLKLRKSPEFRNEDVLIAPTHTHPSRIFLPDIPSLPTVNNEPPGYIMINKGCVVLYEPPTSISPYPPPRAGPSNANLAIPPAKISPMTPAASAAAAGFQRSVQLLVKLNAKLDRLTLEMNITPCGCVKKIGLGRSLHINSCVLEGEQADWKNERSEVERENRKLKELIESQEDLIRQWGKRGSC